MRLFVAIRFSPEVDRRLLAAIDALRRQGRGNFTRAENLHLTLAFLGETERPDDAADAIRRIDAPTFSLELGTLGSFGSLYWAGAAPSPALRTVQSQTVRLLREAGFSPDDRPFRPHLTLCREFVPFRTLDAGAVERALGTPRCRIDRVSLMRSDRLSGRSVYSELLGVPLRKNG